MCSSNEKRMINNVNRCVIALAGIGGVLADGFHSGDILCAVSMLVWLWQGECTAIEEKCVDRLKNLSALKAKA